MAEAINATLRTEFGKGAARRARRANLIPAVLYGHGTDPVHLALPSHETFLILKATSNALLELSFDGNSETALVKSVQKDVVTNDIEHIDLLLLRRGEKVNVEVSVVTEGESAPGTIHSVELQSLAVESLAIAIPTHIVVSVEGLEDGTVVRVSDLQLPEGTTTEVDPETPVVVISVPHLEEELEELEAENALGTDAASDEAPAEESDEA
ncbi:50S ribosomal protein L25/general stress protein Ctc [Serinibacter arcticus]|uniref:Large ribosomal subunit protein bL25 n=1 Tax=Serinibacter arcticus TaxID=1655435 RepID=A0A4Z1DX14_9MICO|nr:50S ribosomal protein L25/general stress protein Ctc [Serinibacter arcticus]TGO04195.1 LSU ribosomal protein L25p [Serinibacter arcticus]